jgi:hypothetical protein
LNQARTSSRPTCSAFCFSNSTGVSRSGCRMTCCSLAGGWRRGKRHEKYTTVQDQKQRDTPHPDFPDCISPSLAPSDRGKSVAHAPLPYSQMLGASPRLAPSVFSPPSVHQWFSPPWDRLPIDACPLSCYDRRGKLGR